VYGITYRDILVVVNRLSKRKRVILYNDITVEIVARMFIYKIYNNHGLPSSIFSDRET
jgi:hypothetical protein